MPPRHSSSQILVTQNSEILFGNRIPKDFFITSGIGESDITIHAGSYHLALKEAGIEMCNIIAYSSILPKIATEIEKPKELVHGSVLKQFLQFQILKMGKEQQRE